MITLSNTLSFIRAPLAFLFLQESPYIRVMAVVLAMITDAMDGYLARRTQSVSRFGAVLDPAMDKFFVYFCLCFLFFEGKVASWQILAMLSRDFFLCFYGVLMFAMGRWKTIVFRAIRWGKITTALQFFVLIGLSLSVSFPWYVYASFVVMGTLAFVELMQRSDTVPIKR